MLPVFAARFGFEATPTFANIAHCRPFPLGEVILQDPDVAKVVGCRKDTVLLQEGDYMVWVQVAFSLADKQKSRCVQLKQAALKIGGEVMEGAVYARPLDTSDVPQPLDGFSVVSVRGCAKKLQLVNFSGRGTLACNMIPARYVKVNVFIAKLPQAEHI